ncbi:DUF5694 domain-containing protein [Sphingorhabdus sp. Alg239-R122]|uniref:DUF5694 domain-containing protein n=1 Tax=Sphingorhabdus sp. Alg239-R122 TaxID=2305989 RepID=UPI0013DB49EF|nr:DUF5694 domain-containing protein [Sphingorhabdus sp. Alg239-R122]
MKKMIAAICLFSLSALPAKAEEAQAEPVRVMVLGTYHFANPGLDLNNAKADDVLAEKRQRELAALAVTLKTFSPDAVAVEARAAPPYADSGYMAFTPADLGRERNETVQIGYRTAHLAGIDRVYAIDEQPEGDEPDYFPYGAVAAQAEETGDAERLKKMSDFAPVLARFEKMQEKQTVPRLLSFWNSDAVPTAFYWDIMTIGKGEKQTGAELAAYWFMRNAKIFGKLTQVTRPGDRVIVVYGSGHNYWLKEMVRNTPGYELEVVQPYLEKADVMLRE